MAKELLFPVISMYICTLSFAQSTQKTLKCFLIGLLGTVHEDPVSNKFNTTNRQRYSIDVEDRTEQRV